MCECKGDVSVMSVISATRGGEEGGEGEQLSVRPVPY